jgi:hypothetical protein
MSKFILTQAYLKEILDYNPVTGDLIWLKSSRQGWVGKKAGAPFKGYLRVKIRNRNYLAHRLAWLWMYGEFPDSLLDHKDEVKDHNWISNLRLATTSQNIQNVGTKANNTSGVKNVHWHKGKNKWCVEFRIKGKALRIGFFDDLEEAARVARKKREELHAEFANHG